MSDLELDPALLGTLQILERHSVEFVVIGDVAEAIYNHGGFVAGLAIVPGAYGRNVERLIAALEALDAQLGIAGVLDTSVDWRRTDLRDVAPCTFMTAHADIDLNFEPLGTRGYQDLFDDAARIEVAPRIRPLVASPEDLDRIRRGAAALLPPAPAPLVLPPEPDDDAGHGDGHWPDEIRASRSRTRTPGRNRSSRA